MTHDNSDTETNDDAEDGPLDRKYPDHLLEQGRERGLSRADREYLASGGETITSESENAHINIRHRIRSRVRESIVDFWLISEYLSDHDRDLVFRESKDDWDNWELQIGLKSAMQFFYTALGESDLTDFETVLTSAIHDAEREMRGQAVLVDIDFDVEVDEQFRVQDAYDDFQSGIPLDPMEVGSLLVTGKVSDPEELQELARHARSRVFIEHTISPLLQQQLESITTDEQPLGDFWYTLAHMPESGYEEWMLRDYPFRSDYQYLENELRFQQGEAHKPATREDFADRPSEKSASDGADEDDSPQGAGHEEYEEVLQRLSSDLGRPITVGDAVVYEDGDRHLLDVDDADADEKGADSPADADDGDADADGADGSR